MLPLNSSKSPSHLPRKVTVGVSGGIAAYKALELVRALQQSGLDPHVVMTDSAERFVTPLTFAAISGHKVITSLWAEAKEVEETLGSAIDHIAEAQSTGLLIVAPATANTLAKFAYGIADDFLSTMYLATESPVVLAPAMNVNMWEHPATQANVAALSARGATIVPPGSGYLACGMTGSGRLADTQVLVEAVQKALARLDDLRDQTILVTAGGTREPIDPVRYIGNRSSGKMGYALASAAVARGAKVILVSAPTALAQPAGCDFVQVTTAAEMRAAVLENLPKATAVIGAAAVSDFQPSSVASEKLRRTGSLSIELEATPDILAEVVLKRRAGTPVVAFAAETDSAGALDSGRAKLERKGVDAIVINDVSRPGLGFDSENNAATILTHYGAREIAPTSKVQLADEILNEVSTLCLAAKQPLQTF